MDRARDHLGIDNQGSYDVVTMDRINKRSAALNLPLPYPGISVKTPTVPGQKLGIAALHDELFEGTCSCFLL